MRIHRIPIGVAALWLAGAASGQPARDYPIQPVPFTAVHFSDDFWAPRFEINRTVTIPFAFEKCEESKRMYHFERAAKVLRGEPLDDKTPPGYPFDDSDLFKVMESAFYTLSLQRDAKLEAYLDGLIAKIAAAQEPDGYLYTTRTIDPANPHRWAGAKRWQLEKVDSHELYNIGHLYEAAVAHFQATGKRSLLEIALRSADLLVRTFGPGKATTWPGHQVTEMGLVKLYRATGEKKYLDLAKFLLDERGPDGSEGAGRTYNQSHVKVVEQKEAVGHAVRATYMYSGMADVAALTGDDAYVHAIDRIWDDVAQGKLYLTGGIGARGSGEAFGPAYELPNLTAYGETCAAVGNDYWNHRLFLLHGDAKYVDVMERTLYNGLLSGVSLDGRSFFYPNPLESNGSHQRSPWFGVACCPGNVTRFLASLPGYVYAQKKDALYVNLFVKSSADVTMQGGRTVKLTQETRYPWEGGVRIAVEPGGSGRFAIHVRIPGWARGEAVPSDLYRFLEPSRETAAIQVNGKPAPLAIEKGYVRLDRTWKAGDVIELSLPMPVRRVVANSLVAADAGRVALQRGPIVYAVEGADAPGGHVRNLMLRDDTPLQAEFRKDLLKGVTTIKGRAVAFLEAEPAATRREQDFVAIPYHAWANRGPNEMAVWIPNRDESARPLPLPTVASKSTVTTSGGRNPRAINDQAEPRSSADASETAFHWWPKKGSEEWVELAFPAAASVSEAQVYWYDDTGTGQVRVPRAWRLLYKDGDGWKPVAEASGYGIEKDAYNEVSFGPVTTTGLRLEVSLQPELSAGILEWKVRSAAANQPGDLDRHFDYDATAPLDVIEIGVDRQLNAVVHDLSYASPKGGRVPAYLVVPHRKGPHAAILWGHWYWENSPVRNRREFLEEALALAGTGVVSLLTDGPIARPGYLKDRSPLNEQQIADLVQQIVDMRRGADLLLARKDVDPKRLGYVGHSYNAGVGAFLSGIDRRFKAFVLMAGSLSDEENLKTDEYQAYRQKVGAEKFDAFAAKFAWTDPGKFVSRAAPAKVFAQFAKQESFLTPERALKHAAIVSEPKRVELYDAPHALNATARRDRLAFLAAELGTRPLEAAAIAGIKDIEQPPEPKRP